MSDIHKLGKGWASAKADKLEDFNTLWLSECMCQSLQHQLLKVSLRSCRCAHFCHQTALTYLTSHFIFLSPPPEHVKSWLGESFAGINTSV